MQVKPHALLSEYTPADDKEHLIDLLESRTNERG